MALMKWAVMLNGVEKSYPQAKGMGRISVLHDVSIGIREGEAMAIVGPSGSGKSTLLNLIGSLDQPTAGKVLVDGKDLGEMDEFALADFRNQNLGFVFQNHFLLPQCTVLENVLLPSLATKDPQRRQRAFLRAPKLLTQLGLKHRKDHRPAQLSGGECQRVAVARAVIHRPRILLADEPTGSLDRQSAKGLVELLLQLNRDEGTSLVVATHSMDLAGQMDRTLELKDGQVRAQSEI